MNNMGTISGLLSEINEVTIARRVGLVHDETRLRYHRDSNTVQNFDEFKEIVTDYCIYHYAECISRGGRLPRAQAYGKSKQLLESPQRRNHGNIVTVFNHCKEGTQAGLRGALDTISEGLKAEAIEHYIQDAFDRYVAPNSWEQKVDMIRQFIAHCGPYLSSYIRTSQPERYAHDYGDLIRSYVEGLQQNSAIFRRL
jgi:hypothetical protein